MPLYLAIDLGTTGCRSIVLNEKLRPLGECYREYGLILGAEGCVEQDAELWWTLTKETARGAIAAAKVKGADIRALSISSQGITIVPVAKDFTPLFHALSWLDVRAAAETARLEKELGTRRVFTLTGKRINAAYSLPKILWLRENEPEVYQKTWKFLMPMDFLVGKLTGECVTDHTMASGTLLYDIKNACWSREMLSHCGIDEEKLPALRWSGEAAGTVLPDVAAELGLSEKCVVAVGAQDQRCASLGVGLRADSMTVSLGTAGAICRLWDAPGTEGSTRVGWSAYVNPGAWVTEGVVNTAGVCLRWLRDTMYPGLGYDLIDAEAADALERGGELLFFPSLSGGNCPDYSTGASGAFYGAGLGTKRGDFALAVMDGVAFQIRRILEEMDAGHGVRTLVLFGGGAKSPLWSQIIADATGFSVSIPESSEAASAGAAILAGIGAGDFSRSAPPSFRISRAYAPDERAQAYEKKYKAFRDVSSRLWKQGE